MQSDVLQEAANAGQRFPNTNTNGQTLTTADIPCSQVLQVANLWFAVLSNFFPM